MMMRFPRKLALIAGLAFAFGSTVYALPAAAAQVSVGIGINVAPPAPRFERMPPPRRGYVWAPGYWQWNQGWHRHVWVGGRWMRVHPGHRYRPARWVRGPRGHWHFHPGRWDR